MAATILGLIGWINQDYITAQWRWYTVTLPYARKQVWPYLLVAEKEHALKPGQSFKECAQDCPEMIVVPAGSFPMGSPPTEKDSSNIERPQHAVTFLKPFAVAKYQLTFADWDACVTGGGCNGYKPNDQGWCLGRQHCRQPVINVNWNDAQAYVAWLSAVTGKTYRLLSEAEYEYTARGGTTTAYPWGDDIKFNGMTMANCSGCGSKWDGAQPAPVGSFAANKFGLYDMVGNVFEWTEDCVHANYNGAPGDGSAWLEAANSVNCIDRLVRGGSWLTPPDTLRSAARSRRSTGTRYDFIGFRVARTLNTR
jgi:formylglycine-generating enzyme required for sulfatase activity